jgi:hypothetical protein
MFRTSLNVGKSNWNCNCGSARIDVWPASRRVAERFEGSARLRSAIRGRDLPFHGLGTTAQHLGARSCSRAAIRLRSWSSRELSIS